MLTQYMQSAGKSPQQLRLQQEERRQQQRGGSRSPGEGEQRSPGAGAAGAGAAEDVDGEKAQPQLGQAQAQGQASPPLSADPGLLGGCTGAVGEELFLDCPRLLRPPLPWIQPQQSVHYLPKCGCTYAHLLSCRVLPV
jgi:hypothetical protein